MKIRQGFVSNSSSSSFICNVCGESSEGWDASPWDSEYESYQCLSGHVFCREEQVGEDITPEEYQEARENEGVPIDRCPICTFSVFSERELHQYLLREYGVTTEFVLAEIKKGNKRRRVVRDNEYNMYVRTRFVLDQEVLLKQVKERFGTHTAFWKYIHNRE